MRRFVFTFAIVSNLLLLDQVVKSAAIHRLKGAPPVDVTWFLNFAYVENRGCAWGMFQGHVWPLAVFGVAALALLVWKRKSVFPSGAWGCTAENLLYAGIIGNLIDRLCYGFVVDMFDFHWGVHHFPCFNVADSCITVAAAILLVTSLWPKGGGKAARAALLLLLGCGACFTSVAGCTPKAVELTAGGTEVVVAPDAPKCVTFAAQELTNFLSRAYGVAIPLSRSFTPGRAAIVLGDCEWSRAAGISTEGFVRDEFAIRSDPVARRIYIAGKDDPKSSPAWAITVGGYPRVEASTLFGVYAFLERFFGCRFYFPGEFGEIVPPAVKVSVPAGDHGRKPAFTVRYVYLSGDGEGYLAPTNRWGRYSEKALNWMRLRMETKGTPCCHGINSFRYPERFGTTHPEYFQLRPDGTRCTNVTINGVRDYRVGHLCFSSAITNVIYSDVKERFLKGARYVDVMPQDGFAPCQCAACQSRFRKDVSYAPASEYVWSWVAALGRRLIEEKVPGTLTMMAYGQYRRVPDIPLPTNILVMVAEQGPWQKVNKEAFARANEEVKAWAKKIGRTVWVWTYPHKHLQSELPTIPQMTPHAWGEYYKNLQPWIFGSFAETESDRWFYNYLNYYVFSRIAWDEHADIDAILDEHYRLMFGAAAADVKGFYGLLEKTWLEGIQGNVDDTPLGPVARIPPLLTVWREIYSPAMIAECERLLDAAAAKLSADSGEGRRLAFIRAQLFEPMKTAAENYLDGILVERELARRAKRAGTARVLQLGKPARTYHAEFLPSPFIPGGHMVKYSQDFGLAQWNLDLKPDTVYRVSYFLKLDGVFKRKDWKGCNGGAMMEYHDGEKSERVPYPVYEDGTFDWIHRSFTFTTPSREKMKQKPYVMPRVLHCIGTAWFDGLQIEEVK